MRRPVPTPYFEIAGWIGALLILGAYFGLNAHWIPLHGFHMMNLAGASGIVLGSAPKRAWPAVALNAAYGLLAGAAVLGWGV